MSNTAVVAESGLDEAEETLLRFRFARRDPKAFDDVVAMYQSRVTRLVQRLLAWSADTDDVVQDVFLAAFSKAGSFRGESSLWTWLTALTLNRCRRYHRKAALVRRLLSTLGLSAAGHAPAADIASGSNETAQQVRFAVAALPPMEREVIVLYYLEQRPMSQISELLCVSSNALQVRMHRGRQKLKSALAELGKP